MNKKLKAPQVDRYLWWLGQMDYQKYDHASKYDARSYELLDELFELLKNIKTLEGSSAWKFWIRAERGTIEDYGDYEEMFDCGEVENHEDYLNRWKTEYPDETEWYEFQALDEKTIGYKAIFVRHKFVIVLDSRKPMVGYEYDISEFSQWLVDAVKEVISELKEGTYNERLSRELPDEQRTGTVLRKYQWEVRPKIREEIFGDLSEADLAEFLSNAEEKLSDNSRLLTQMTANDFYRYCAMGYAANGYDCCDKPPKEQYLKHADGRDDGLRNIDPDSPEAFSDWYHNHIGGGHPWEVCRGGNSTHVSLYVHPKDNGWYLSLAGSAWTRCQETMKFFLALHRAGLPVTVYEAPVLKARVLGEEKVGIVPLGVFPAYCHSYFPGETVIDFMNLPGDEDDRNRLVEHCIWQPLEYAELSEG